MLLDSNILIYAAEPEGVFLRPLVADATACIASASRIETLGFPGWHRLDEARQARLETMVDGLVVLSLDERIAARAIDLRRRRKMTLGDSIIAATALEFGKRLVTRNDADFRHIPGLEIVNPFAPA